MHGARRSTGPHSVQTKDCLARSPCSRLPALVPVQPSPFDSWAVAFIVAASKAADMVADMLRDFFGCAFSYHPGGTA